MLRSTPPDDVDQWPGNRFLLGFDVQPHTRTGLHNLLEGRHPDSLSAKGPLAFQIYEMIPGVQVPDFGQRKVGNGPAPIRRAIDSAVMNDDDVTVTGQANIHLEHVGTPVLDRGLEGGKRVLGGELRPASVRHEHGCPC
jgi:hypothetical protein